MKGINSVLFKLFLLIAIAYVSCKTFKPMNHTDVLTIAGVLSTVAGILFGFVLAAISIFSSADGNKDGAIKALKRNNILPTLITRLLSTGFTLILACVLPMIAMFLSPEVTIFSKPIDYLFVIFGFSSLILSMFTFTRCWNTLKHIFPHL
ncbi:Uncharacterised protein [Yersinia enterocolitica]|uniref:hypothetical protein n=1 Tax=Yersinia enterocolitica TaxID=630 RepID=UPI0005E7F864|nr:hypothetical protein [Yersinia enterocolitica]CQD39706.1 Uncharacterised protein [Yersinia enterocolitica]CQH71688.1 Uncharacterised protein [Yersinia enterocolitica]CQQ79919.1 Uncharacterised protein [Yersinia enterocolitica]